MTATAISRPGLAPRQRTHRTLIVQYLLRYKWRFLLGFVAVTAASFLVLLPPLVLRRAVDSIEAGVSGRRLAGYAGIILLLAVVESGLSVLARYMVAGTSRKVEYELRNDLAKQ